MRFSPSGRPPRRFALGALLALFAFAPSGAGCGSTASDLVGGGYSESARDNYEQGMKALSGEDFDTAVRYFRYVKAKFPFSKYAVLSDLRIADAEFVHEDYIEAIDSYKQFAQFHPTHEYVTNGYCSYKVGESYYKQIPDDWWLMPPSYEMDETAALDADQQLEAFLDKFPESDYTSKAKDLLTKVHELLAAHEWYVADFYAKRDDYRGTAFRLETLLTRYPETSFAPRALLRLGEAYLRLGEPWNARPVFARLVAQHPGDATSTKAREYLAELDHQYGAGGPPVPKDQTLPRLHPTQRPVYQPPAQEASEEE